LIQNACLPEPLDNADDGLMLRCLESMSTVALIRMEKRGTAKEKIEISSSYLVFFQNI